MLNDKKYSLNLNSIFLLIGILAFIFGAGVNYGALMGLKEDVSNFQQDYARKDVINVQLSNIENQLKEIKEAISRKDAIDVY